VLVINGDFTQGSFGTLKADVGGTTAGTGYDQLQISGAATLAGTLNVSTIGGFLPSSGDVFTVLTFGSRSGTFGSITGTLMTPSYGSADFRLLAMADVEPEAEQDGRPRDEGDRPLDRQPRDEGERLPGRPLPVSHEADSWGEAPQEGAEAPLNERAAQDLIFIGEDFDDSGAPLQRAAEDLLAMPFAALEAMLAVLA
jgi:hypothetical protein